MDMLAEGFTYNHRDVPILLRMMSRLPKPHETTSNSTSTIPSDTSAICLNASSKRLSLFSRHEGQLSTT